MHVRRTRLLLATLFLVGALASTSPASAATLPLVTTCGDASLISSPGVGAQVATQGHTYRVGAAWSSRFSTLGDFTASFTYTLSGNGSTTYGDGFAFVVQTTSSSAAGDIGAQLGYSSNSAEASCRTIGTSNPSFAVGFHDFANALKVGSNGSWGTPLQSNMKLEGTHSVTITKVGATVSVRLDRKVIGSFSVASSYQRAYVGFTGGTGSATQNAQIYGITITTP